MFIMSLAVADLIVGLIVMPISSFDFITDSGQGTICCLSKYLSIFSKNKKFSQLPFLLGQGLTVKKDCQRLNNNDAKKTASKTGLMTFVSGWRFGVGVCLTYLSIDYTASTASIFNLFILSLDRSDLSILETPG